MTHSSRRVSNAAALAGASGKAEKPKNVCILSMASPLRPGGGFLDGATSQEEFLCMRTTLYPSLWDDFYRLPEIGGIVTSDVLVHRDSTPQAIDLPKRERFFVDVISSAMLRFPETNSSKRIGAEEGTEGACSCGVSYCDRDRELVTLKMRAVMRMAQAQGAEKLVLGAWGCGAYGNPVKEVAKIWKRVLFGTARKPAKWTGIKEIIFAIHDRGMLREFEKCFEDVVTHDARSASPPPAVVDDQAEGQKTPNSELINELVSKIQETELQLDQISSPRSKARLREIISNLNGQLAKVGADDEEDEALFEDATGEGADESNVDGIMASDGEENSYYNFDSDDVASSGSISPAASDLYEFRIPSASESDHAYSPRRDGRSDQNGHSMGSPYEYVDGAGVATEEQFDHESGWFTGSINGLSAMLSKPERVSTSPVLRPQSSNMEVDEIGMGLGEYLRRYSQQDI